MASVYSKQTRATSNESSRRFYAIVIRIGCCNLYIAYNDVRRLMSTNIDVFAPQKQSELSRLHMRVTELEENVAKLTALVDTLTQHDERNELYGPRKAYHLADDTKRGGSD